MADKTINDITTAATSANITDTSAVILAAYKTDETAGDRDRKLSLSEALKLTNSVCLSEHSASPTRSFLDGQLSVVDAYSTSHAVGDGSGQVLKYDSGSSATVDGGFVFAGVLSSGDYANYQGEWDSLTAYTLGQIVWHYGQLYEATAGTTGDVPSTLTNWSVKATTGRFVAVDQSEANIKKFGAIGDASTDDWEPIQNAIDAAEATGSDTSFQTVVTTGNAIPVRVPKGVYVVGQTLVSSGNTANSYSSLRIIGDGRHASYLQASDTFTGAELIRFDPVNTPTIDANNGWELRDLCIEGPNPSFVAGSETLVGINALKSAYWRIENCKIRFWKWGIQMRNWSTQTLGNRIEYCDRGIYFDNSAGIDGSTTINDHIIQRNSFGNCPYGLVTANSLPINYLTITNNQFDGATRAAIILNGPVESFAIEDNYLEAQGTTGVATISTNDSGGTTTVNCAIAIHPTTNNTSAASGSIKRNLFINCNTTASISVSGIRQLEIKDNRVAGNAVTSFVNVEDACSIPSGPLPYTVTKELSVDGSTVDNNNNTIVTNLVNIDNTETSISRIEAVDRKLSIHEAPFLNDLEAWEDIGTTPILRSDSSGETTWVYNGGLSNLRKRIIVTFDSQSGWSNSIIRLHGQCRPTGGTGGFFVRVTIDAVFVKDLYIPSFSAGSWGVGRTECVKLPASGTLQLELFRDTSLAAATSIELRNFCVCTAAHPLKQPPVLKPARPQSRDTYADLFLSTVEDGQRILVERYSSSHTTTDGSGQLVYYDSASSATIDGGHVFPGIGGALAFTGTTFSGTAGIGRFIAVDQKVANVSKFGASSAETASNNWSALQRAVNTLLPVELPNETIAIDQTVTINNAYQLIFGDSELSQINTKITDGSSTFLITSDKVSLRDFSIWGDGATTDYTSYTNATGIEFSNANRYKIENIDCRLLNRAYYFNTAFIGSAINIWAKYCTLGFEASVINASSFELNIEECLQYMVLSASNSVRISLLAEGGGGLTAYANGMLSSTIDGCRSVTFDRCYLEEPTGLAGTRPALIKIGHTTANHNLAFRSLNAVCEQGLAAVFDVKNTNGIEFEGTVDTDENTNPLIIDETTVNNADFRRLLKTSVTYTTSRLGVPVTNDTLPIKNLCPDPFFDRGAPPGAVSVGVVTAIDTTDVLPGHVRSLNFTQTAGAGTFTNYQWRIPLTGRLASLAGKSIMHASYVKANTGYTEGQNQGPNLTLRARIAGVDGNISEVGTGKYFQNGKWHLAVNRLDVDATADEILVQFWMNRSGVVPGANLDANLGGLLIWEGDWDGFDKVSNGLIYGVDPNETQEPTVDTYDDLMGGYAVDGDVITVLRYTSSHTVGDGSGQEVYYDASSTATVDGGFVFPGRTGTLSFASNGSFNGDAGDGRFIAVDQTHASVQRFGARPSSPPDSNTAIIRAFNAATDNDVPVHVGASITVDTWPGYTVTSGETLIIKGTAEDAAIIYSGVSNLTLLYMNGDNLKIDDVLFNNWQYPILMGSTSIDTVHLNRCKFNTCDLMIGDTGEGNASCQHLIVENCRGATLARAGVLYRALTIGDVRVTNNTIENITNNTGTQGIQVGGNQNTVTSDGILVSGNQISSVTDTANPVYGILIYGPNAVCRDNVLNNIYSSVSSGYAYGIYTKSLHAVIDGNHLTNAGYGGTVENRGINCKGADRDDVSPTTPYGYGCRITNNRVFFDQTLGTNHACIDSWNVEAVISGNHVEGGENGIVIEGDWSLASNNTVYACTERAFYIFDASDISLFNNHIKQVTNNTWPYLVSSSSLAVERITINGGSAEDNGTTTRAVLRLECASVSIDDVSIDNIDGTGWGDFCQPGGAAAANVGRVVIKGGCKHDGFYYSGVNSGMIVDGIRGTGTPESVVVSAPGGRYIRTDGGAGTCMYIKESGTATTGWVAK